MLTLSIQILTVKCKKVVLCGKSVKIQAMSNSNYAPVKMVRIAFMSERWCKSTFHMHIRNERDKEQKNKRSASTE